MSNFNKATIHKLNEACLLKIFRNLKPHEWLSISKVCMNWNKLATENLWTDFHTFKIYNSSYDHYTPYSYLKSDELLTTENIIIEEYPITFFEVIDFLIQIGPNLQKICLFIYNSDKTDYAIFYNSYRYTIKQQYFCLTILKTLLSVSSQIKSIELFNIGKPEEDFWLQKLIKKNVTLKSFIVEDLGFANIKNVLTSLTGGIEKLEIRFKTQNSDFQKFLDKLTNIKEIRCTYADWSGKEMSFLMKNAQNIRSLKLDLFFRREDDSECWDFSKLVNLEKIELLGYHPCFYNLDYIFDCLKNCQHLSHVKLAFLCVKNETLTKILALPNLQVLYLKSVSGCDKLLPLKRMPNFTTLKITDGSSVPLVFFETVYRAFSQMPFLTDFYVIENTHHYFCKKHFFSTFIKRLTFEGKILLVEPVKNVLNYLNKSIKIHPKEVPSGPCFRLKLRSGCLDYYDEKLLQSIVRLPKHEILKSGFKPIINI